MIFADPCTGARKAGTSPARTPHGASITANPTGHASLPGGRATGDLWSLPTNRLGSGMLRRIGEAAGHATFRYASLRATCRCMPRTAPKGTGDRAKARWRGLRDKHLYIHVTAMHITATLHLKLKQVAQKSRPAKAPSTARRAVPLPRSACATRGRKASGSSSRKPKSKHWRVPGNQRFNVHGNARPDV